MCQSCQAGKYGVSCSDCLTGMYRPGGNDVSAEECFSCPKGWHQNNNGSAACLSCQTGKYYNRTNGIKCTACEVGRYRSNEMKATLCIDCLVGFSQEARGQEIIIVKF